MTVTQLNLKAKALLETHFENIPLSGELSKITFHSSGHWYFELKDENSSIACAMFKNSNSRLDFKPQIGELLELEGNLSLFSQNGRYQFLAHTMKKSGFGDLEKEFLALKEKLEKEGLFSNSHKKALPKFPTKIGIISSITSAALEDMLKIITYKENFLAKIYIFNALTQGTLAANSLINALKKADKAKLDVLILARGGGSREDLFCFNDENLAREIFKINTPIISAIGHEIDYVISDFVADLRAPTPSAAIDLLLYSKLDLEQNLDHLEDNLKNSFRLKMQNYQKELDNLEKILKSNSLALLIAEKSKQNESLEQQLKTAIIHRIKILDLNLEKLQNAYLQHKNFFEKSKNLICVKKNDKIIKLEDLKSGEIVTLTSQTSKKEAKIL